jgi:hypothetical protein
MVPKRTERRSGGGGTSWATVLGIGDGHIHGSPDIARKDGQVKIAKSFEPFVKARRVEFQCRGRLEFVAGPRSP